MPRAHNSRFSGLLSWRIPFLWCTSSNRWSGRAQLGGHDLDVFGDVAVLARVRMIRFEDEDIASVDVPTESLTKRRERAII
jgi:hypothetical protein